MNRADYLTLSEAAESLNMQENALRVAVQKGLIGYTRAFGDELLVRKDSLENYRFSHQRKTGNEYPQG